jgi:galactitol-specific phosphotransferase system IIC component
MFHASMFSLARAAGRQFMPGLDVPVADVGEVWVALVLLAALLLLLALVPRAFCAVRWPWSA